VHPEIPMSEHRPRRKIRAGKFRLFHIKSYTYSTGLKAQILELYLQDSNPPSATYELVFLGKEHKFSTFNFSICKTEVYKQ
jgi:hypothetical protein